MQLVDSSTNIVYNLLIDLRLQNLSGEEDRVGYKGSEEANFFTLINDKCTKNYSLGFFKKGPRTPTTI